MTDALIIGTIFLGIASTISLPIAVVMAGWLGRSWLRLKESELDLRRLEVAARLREAHYERLPSYVNVNDPAALLDWARTDRELSGLAPILTEQ